MSERMPIRLEDLPWPPSDDAVALADFLDEVTTDADRISIACTHKALCELGLRVAPILVFPDRRLSSMQLFIELTPERWALMFLWTALMRIPRYAAHPLSSVTWDPSKKSASRPGDGTLTIGDLSDHAEPTLAASSTTAQEEPC